MITNTGMKRKKLSIAERRLLDLEVGNYYCQRFINCRKESYKQNQKPKLNDTTTPPPVDMIKIKKETPLLLPPKKRRRINVKITKKKLKKYPNTSFRLEVYNKFSSTTTKPLFDLEKYVMTGYDTLTVKNLKQILSNHRKEKIHSLYLKLNQKECVKLDDDIWLGLIHESMQRIHHYGDIILQYEYTAPLFTKQITKSYILQTAEVTKWWQKKRVVCFQTLGQLRETTSHAI